MTRRTIIVLRLVALSLALSGAALAEPPKRQMNVTQGPETVFKQPVSQIMSQLTGAKPTGRNGRVGNEFVFWGYRLLNGAPAYFYACAAVEGVDCLARREMICTEQPAKVLSENISMGEVQKLECKPICQVDSPTAMPCCTGAQQVADLQVGLVSCGS